MVYVVGKVWVPSWSWSYGSWIYNSLCNQCLTVSQFHLHPHPFLLTGVKIHVHVYLTWNQELLTKPSSTWVGWLDLLWNVFVIYCKHNYFFHPSSDFNPELNVNRVLRHFIHIGKKQIMAIEINHITSETIRFSPLHIWFWFDFWCLTPLSAIFQLYHGDQF